MPKHTKTLRHHPTRTRRRHSRTRQHSRAQTGGVVLDRRPYLNGGTTRTRARAQTGGIPIRPPNGGAIFRTHRHKGGVHYPQGGGQSSFCAIDPANCNVNM